MRDEIEYFGTVQLTSGRTPLLASERDRDSINRDLIRSGGVIFTREEEMPLLEELLKANEVLYAVLEKPDLSADAAKDVTIETDWRERERQRLERHLSARQQDHVFDEDLAFLALVDEETLDALLASAHRLLSDPHVSEAEWELFLADQNLCVSGLLLPALPPLVDEGPDVESAAQMPLLSIESLELTFRRGAMGGPPPLAAHAE